MGTAELKRVLMVASPGLKSSDCFLTLLETVCSIKQAFCGLLWKSSRAGAGHYVTRLGCGIR